MRSIQLRCKKDAELSCVQSTEEFSVSRQELETQDEKSIIYLTRAA